MSNLRFSILSSSARSIVESDLSFFSSSPPLSSSCSLMLSLIIFPCFISYVIYEKYDLIVEKNQIKMFNNQRLGVISRLSYCQMEKEPNKVHILYYKRVDILFYNINNKIRTHKKKQIVFSCLIHD